jgi:hypothetical protein
MPLTQRQLPADDEEWIVVNKLERRGEIRRLQHYIDFVVSFPAS